MGLKESRLFDQNYDELATVTKFSKAEIRKWHRGFQLGCLTKVLKDQLLPATLNTAHLSNRSYGKI